MALPEAQSHGVNANGHNGLAFASPACLSQREQEINDSNVPFGSGNCLNEIFAFSCQGRGQFLQAPLG